MHKKIENTLRNLSGLSVSSIVPDAESKEYEGLTFRLGTMKIIFRNAKTTPKKAGQFVTLWRRNEQGVTQPFSHDSGLDFVMIWTEKDTRMGFFLFPKEILIEKKILKTPQKDGKRGFRVYPDWDEVENKQAYSTKQWQTDYFIDLNLPWNITCKAFAKMISVS